MSDSFMDYAMPKAIDMCSIETYDNPTKTSVNPIGVKGAGETGTVGAPPAVINAIVNALSSVGVRDIEMPATPERVWKALQMAA